MAEDDRHDALFGLAARVGAQERSLSQLVDRIEKLAQRTEAAFNQSAQPTEAAEAVVKEASQLNAETLRATVATARAVEALRETVDQYFQSVERLGQKVGQRTTLGVATVALLTLLALGLAANIAISWEQLEHARAARADAPVIGGSRG